MHLLILHLAHIFGGAEKSTAHLLSYLDRSRITRITLVAPAELKPHLPEAYDFFVDAASYSLESGFTTLDTLHRDARATGELLRALEPDVAFGMMHYSSSLLAFGARLAGVRTRIIASYRSPFYEHIRRYEQDWQRRDFLQAMVAETALLADRVIVPSQGMADELQQRFRTPISRIVVIPNGIDLAKVTEAAQAATPELADFDHDEIPVLCAIARLAPEKNLGLLLEAFQRVRAVCPAILAILGDGPEREALEAQITPLGLVDAIRFLGHRVNVYPYLRRADLFIHTCQYEGFGHTLLEALACGAAVISTDCPYGPREVLDHGKYGMLVPTDDPDQLAESILDLLKDPAKRQALATRGLDRAKQLSIQRMVNAYEAEFIKLGGAITSDILLAPREEKLGFNLSYNNLALVNQFSPYKFVNICMITYNRLEFTRQSLEALFRHTDFPYVLTVVDNGSNDGTIEYLQFLYQKNLIKNLILFGTNVGVAKAANVGWVCEPEADYYIKLDNDIVMQGPWLSAMVDVVNAIPEAGAVAYNVEACSYSLITINNCDVRVKETGNLGGANTLISKRTHDKIGFWCEEYGLYGEEDADYGRRIECAKMLNIYMADENLAFHLPSGKNAVIDQVTFESSEGGEEYSHPDYRRWKDEKRRHNIFNDSVYVSNMNGYISGTKSLYVQSCFAREWLLCRRTVSNWNDLWSDEIYRVTIPGSCRKDILLSIVFSTRKVDPQFVNHLRSTVGIQDVEIITYVNQGEFSLTELYNRGLRESRNDIVVFIHDDIAFNHQDWGNALLKQFRETDYGILGIAGTTDLIFEKDGIAGRWWFMHHRRVGKVKHHVNNKAWDTVFSNSYQSPIQVVCLDGVFISVDKKRLQKLFDERFKGFHYYDISFTFANHLAGVKVGVTFEISLTHQSTGKINEEWYQSRLLFSKIYKNFLPCGVKPEKIEYDVSTIRKFNFGNSLISIIIPTKNKINLLIDCIQSIIDHTHITRYEILIADTGSTVENKNKLLDWIKNLGKKNNLVGIKIIEYGYYNFAKINNNVVKNHLSKKSNYILFCNNDIVLLNDALDRCLYLFRERKNVGTVGIRLHYADNSIQHNGMEMLIGFGSVVSFSHRNLGSYYTYDSKISEVIGNTAAFLMIERPLFEKRYFNENYIECYEDVELNLEMLRLGRKNYHIGHAVAYHYESQTRNSDPDKNSRMTDDYQNHLLPYFKKYCVPLFFTQLFKGASQASRMGQFQTAIEICELLLKHAPSHADVHHLFGVVLGRKGDQVGAVKYIRQAIALNEAIPDYHYNLAEALRRQGEWALAEQSYERALQLAPSLIDAYVQLAYLLEDQGRLDQAVARYQQALRIKPDHAPAYCGMGDALRRQGAYGTAVECYQRALAIQPDFAEAHHNLGLVSYAANHLNEAAAYFQQALYYKPDWLQALTSLGMTLERQGLTEEARECHGRVLALNPNDALLRLRVESLCPPVMSSNTDIEVYRNRLRARLEEMHDRGEGRLDLERLHASSFEPPSLLVYQGRDDRTLKEAWAVLFRNLLPEVVCSPPAGGKPRIGFVVTRGHEGVFLKGMGGLLNQLSAERFDLTLICSQQGGEARLRPALHNPAIRYMSLPERIEPSLDLFREVRFHLLYYWEVGTDSVNYFLPFFRLAPVQCTGWGWPVTSGIPQMDYYLSSQSLETADSDAHYSERLVRLQRLPTYFHRPEPPRIPVEREHFGLTAGQPVYLCAQNLRKLHPDFDQLLAGLLRRDPRGVVVLVEDAQPAITAALRQRLLSHLPDVVERIRFLPRLPHQDYLDLLAAADVVLDTLHFGGGVTTYETFAIGTPIVTLPTAFSRGRYACAAYRQMGLTEGIASNVEDYIERALRFANEPDDRAAFSARLREASTELFEDRQAVQEFEAFIEAAVAGAL